eukprot:s9_g25.t1
MCNVGLVPFVCLSHPNDRYSILNYPNTLCGTTEHSTMQWVGVLVLALSLTHVILCAWALHHAPAWSLNSPQRLASIGFLLINYRPSCWWFGMVILVRGPLLSLGQVLAPSVGALQLLSMSCTILSSLCLQTWFLPWKVPLVNLVDTVSTSLFLMLLGVALNLTPPTGSYLDAIGTGLYYLSLGIILLVALLCFMLVAWDYCFLAGLLNPCSSAYLVDADSSGLMGKSSTQGDAGGIFHCWGGLGCKYVQIRTSRAQFAGSTKPRPAENFTFTVHELATAAQH